MATLTKMRNGAETEVEIASFLGMPAVVVSARMRAVMTFVERIAQATPLC